ncbi:hypothetical protein [Neptunicella sp.]|uniref:hypothetical protein n=1 Tax=Neptunicella sp. TaxID=2125986 RepID=UPI003F6945BB
MLNLKTSFIIAAVSLPLLANAATTYVAADNSRESKLCVSAAMDSRIGFYITYKKSGKGLHYIANSITCNNLLIGDFANQAGNTLNANHLAKFQRVKGHALIKDYALTDKQNDSEDKIVLVHGG